MIISAHQPYFCPYPGFFYKALLSDILVILDEVQFPQRTTWIRRNRFKNDQGTLWMTIPVWKKGLGRQQINQVRVCYEGRWARKHPESLKSFYVNAPYLGDHLGFIEKIFSSRFEKLIDLNLAIIRYLFDCMQIETRLVLLSELGVKAQATLHRGWVRTQREAFRHPYCAFTPATRLAYFVFGLRALTSYRQRLFGQTFAGDPVEITDQLPDLRHGAVPLPVARRSHAFGTSTPAGHSNDGSGAIWPPASRSWDHTRTSSERVSALY